MMPTTIFNPAQIDFETPGKRHYEVAFHLDSSWGYSLVPLTVIRGARRSVETTSAGVAVFGGTHGNEWEGQVAARRLAADLDPSEISGLVILVSQLSPSACSANTRVSPLDGVNMNRAFPGNPRGTVSYRIADFAKAVLFPRVATVIDLHSGGHEAAFPLCASIHRVADPKQLARMVAAAKLFDTPFVFLYSSEMASGLLTDEVESEGKIAIGGEFGYAESVNLHGLRHAYEGVKNVLRSQGMLPGEHAAIDPNRGAPPRLIAAERLDDYVPCPANGIWEPAVAPGAYVQAGDLLGRLHNFSGPPSSGLEIAAHRSGIVAAMHFAASVKRGSTLYVLAQEIQI